MSIIMFPPEKGRSAVYFSDIRTSVKSKGAGQARIPPLLVMSWVTPGN